MARDLSGTARDLGRAYALIIDDDRGQLGISRRRAMGGRHRTLAAANGRLGRPWTAAAHAVRWAASDPVAALALALTSAARYAAKRDASAWLARIVLALLRLTPRRAGVALLYHRVSERAGNPDRELDPPLDASTFRRHLRHLRTNYKLVPADRYLDAVRDRRRGERFPVCITFDDDPEHVACSLPALQESGAPATFFLCGAFLEERPRSFWWQRLQRSFDAGELPHGLPSSALDLHTAAATITQMNPDDIETVSDLLLEFAGPDRPGSDLVTTEAASTLTRPPAAIGFHTRRHLRMTALDDRGLERALEEGRAELEQLAGSPVTSIAYPHGSAGRREADAARRAGFWIGFTDERRAATPESDPLLLGRLNPSRATLGEFALLLVQTLSRVNASIERPAKTVTQTPKGLAPVGSVRFGQLRRDTPFSRTFGFDRGQPIDRFYIDDFLAEQAGRTADGPARIKGHVLEIGEDRYASRFARAGAIERLDILDVTHDNPQATIVANLTDGRTLPSDEFDCVICTQTLLLIYDLHAAVRTLHKILKPGGNVLVTLPGISQICRPEIDLSASPARAQLISAVSPLGSAAFALASAASRRSTIGPLRLVHARYNAVAPNRRRH